MANILQRKEASLQDSKKDYEATATTTLDKGSQTEVDQRAGTQSPETSLQVRGGVPGTEGRQGRLRDCSVDGARKHVIIWDRT